MSKKKTLINVDKEEAVRSVKEIISALRKTFPDAKCSLDHRNALELLISTILSAQCTDERVNKVTAELYKRYKTPSDWAQTDIKQIEQDVRSTGFYKNKARNIKAACQMLVEKFDSQVPDNLEELTTLPGVGRKTANVVLGAVFGVPGIICDTHVIRVSRRLALSTNSDPVKLEFDLMEIVPEKDWTNFSHMMVLHGRYVCKARKPDCENCVLSALCPSANNPELW